MELRLNVEGASPQEIERGLNAAREVFNRTGIDPLTANQGMFAMEGWDITGSPDKGTRTLTDEESAAADAWVEASDAAIAACCEHWDASRPNEGTLELILTLEEQNEPLISEVGTAEDLWP